MTLAEFNYKELNVLSFIAVLFIIYCMLVSKDFDISMILWNIIFNFICAIYCFKYMKTIKYNVNVSFTLGFLFNIIALPICFAIYYYKKDSIVE